MVTSVMSMPGVHFRNPLLEQFAEAFLVCRGQLMDEIQDDGIFVVFGKCHQHRRGQVEADCNALRRFDGDRCKTLFDARQVPF